MDCHCHLIPKLCLTLQLHGLYSTPVHVASLSVEFSRQLYCSGLPFPSPGDLSDRGTEPVTPVSPALAGGFFNPEPPGEAKEAQREYAKEESWKGKKVIPELRTSVTGPITSSNWEWWLRCVREVLGDLRNQI